MGGGWVKETAGALGMGCRKRKLERTEAGLGEGEEGCKLREKKGGGGGGSEKRGGGI